MNFRFTASVSAPAGRLSREDKTEIRDYIQEQCLEAAAADKALKALCKKLQGKNFEANGRSASFLLPDYGRA